MEKFPKINKRTGMFIWNSRVHRWLVVQAAAGGSSFHSGQRSGGAATRRTTMVRWRRTLGPIFEKHSKIFTLHSWNSWIFSAKNPERVECGGKIL